MLRCAHPHWPSRRLFLCCSASAALDALIGTLLVRSSVARAEPISGEVPTVDRVALRVVTDSYQLAIAPSGRFGNVEVTRFGMPPAGKSLLGEFGLAMHVESNAGGEARNMLIDFGFTSDTLENNLAMLGIAPETLDALVLSHGHYDHFGGLAGFLEHNQRKLRPDLPLYIGGEEAFARASGLPEKSKTSVISIVARSPTPDSRFSSPAHRRSLPDRALPPATFQRYPSRRSSLRAACM